MTAHGADVSNAALQVTSGIDRTLVAAIDMVHATVSRRAAKPTAAVHSTDVDDAPILAAFGAVAERAGALPSPLGRSLGDGDAARLIEERVRHWEGAVRAASETLHACLERTSSLATAPVPSLEQRVWSVGSFAARLVQEVQDRPSGRAATLPLEGRSLSGVLDVVSRELPGDGLMWDPELTDVHVPISPRYVLHVRPEAGGTILWCPMDDVHDRWGAPAVDHFDLPIPFALACSFAALASRRDLSDEGMTSAPELLTARELVLLDALTGRAVTELRRVLGSAYTVTSRHSYWGSGTGTGRKAGDGVA